MDGSDLVPQNPPSHAIALPGLHGDSSLLSSQDFRVLTSLSKENPQDREALARALIQSDSRGREAVNKTLLVSHFVLNDSVRVDKETGEVTPIVQLTLLDPEGHAWATTSPWAIRTFKIICGAFGFPPWHPPRHLQITPYKTSAGFDGYKLLDVTPVLTSPAPPRAKKAI